MTIGLLCWRGLAHHWRANAVVAAGVALATAVLTGALVVGASVRHGLGALALERLGPTEVIVEAPRLVRAAIADEVSATSSAPGWTLVPMLTLEGAVSGEGGGRRASRVAIHGVDERFWRFHGAGGVAAPTGRAALLSPALATELAAARGDRLLVTVERQDAVPAGLLAGRRTDRVVTFRAELDRALDSEAVGEFSPRATQAAVRAVFLPLGLLQRALGLGDRVNTFLAARRVAEDREDPDIPSLVEGLRVRLLDAMRLEDHGVRLRPTEDPSWLSVESPAGVLDDGIEAAVAEAGRRLDARRADVLAHVANTIRVGDRAIPYSVVAGLDLRATGDPTFPLARAAEPREGRPRIWVNEWAARRLGARPGDVVALDYFTWSDEGGLREDTATFALAGTIPMTGVGGDRTLVPDYPGLTGADRMADWEPPFPVDFSRIQPADEDYWRRYRTAPKAFVELDVARRLWVTRHGRATSIRLAAPAGHPRPAGGIAVVLRQVLSASATATVDLRAARAEALWAARGTTDFGEYFAYFTAVVAGAALLFAALLFRLLVEQRVRELGLLGAIGWPPIRVQRLLLVQATVVAAAGAALGALAAIGWAALVMVGLRTWWIGAVGTDRLALHLTWSPVLAGAAAVALVSAATLWLTVRSLLARSAHDLLLAAEPDARATAASGGKPSGERAWRSGAAAFGGLALACLGATWMGRIPLAAGFLLTGSLALAACLLAFAAWLRHPPRSPIVAGSLLGVLRLGAREARRRPGRATAGVALVAVATFIIVAVGGFRRASPEDGPPPGTGGFALIGESAVPLLHDPTTAEGREAMSLGESPVLTQASFTRLRLRAGDEASCLTLYRPARPRVAGVPEAFRRANRFPFAASLAATDAERGNPWRLLERRFDDGAVPVVGDANSLTYVFRLGLGDTISLPSAGGAPITLRVVGLLADSVFQSELIVAEEWFVRLFPHEPGFRLLLVDAAPGAEIRLLEVLEDRLSDHGLDLQPTAARLAAYHRVENTFIGAFQSLGVLGLLLGTTGVGLTVLRGVIERRRELALLLAVGFRRRHLALMIVAESVLVAACGAALGTVCALISTAPALAAGGRTAGVGPSMALPVLVVAVAAASAWSAVSYTARLPVAGTLREE